MNSIANGSPVMPRSRCIAEFNVLWYDVLKYTVVLAGESEDLKTVDHHEALATKYQESFMNTFYSEHGYLFDYIDDGHPNWGV